jgi:ABC-type amino acid transport substrate-binding protein
MKTIAVALFVAAASIPAAFAQPSPTLARIKSAGAINVAYSADSLPFSFTETNGEAMGYSIDLCKRVIAQIGRAVGTPNLKVNWIPASTPARLQMVATGKADLDCANTTQTIARLDNVDFSSLIFLETGGFIGRKDSPAKLGDMGGKKIAVLKGTTTESRLRAALQQKLVNANVIAIENAGDGMAMLEMGSADLFAGDRIKLIGLVTQAKDPTKFTLLGEEISYEPYAFALPRNDSAYRLEVNRALTQVYISGEIEGIYGQWLGRLGKPSQLLMGMYLLYAIPD